MRMTAKQLAFFGFVWMAAAAGVVCFTAGCKPSAKKQAAIEQRLRQEMEELATKIQECQAQGQLAEGLALAEKGLSTATYAPQKPRYFALKVDILLAQGNDAAVSALLLATWKAEPALAQGLFGRLYGHYQQQNNSAAALAWCGRLLDLGESLPADLRRQVLDWHLATSLATRDVAACEASITQIMKALPPQDAVALLQPALGGLVDAGQHVLAALLAKHVSGQKDLAAPYRDLVVTLTVRCLLAASDWANLTPAFNACAEQLTDEPLLKIMRQVFTALQKANQRELLEQSSRHVVFSAPAKTNSVNFASRLWVECGVAQSKKILPERLQELLAAQVSPVQVGNLYDRYFYDMVSEIDVIRSLCSLGERILAVCKDENTVNNIKLKILDGAFLVENYDLAVQMLEAGIPGKDKTWHDMSIPKVKAHRAMAQKNPRDAVKYFREFMNAWLSSNQEEEYDPTSGIAYSREWILGRNANRIAGILDSIPDKAEADKARAEAKAYFKVAVEKAKPDAEATRLIKEETKDMGL
jgi:hypothetical protein